MVLKRSSSAEISDFLLNEKERSEQRPVIPERSEMLYIPGYFGETQNKELWDEYDNFYDALAQVESWLL